MTQPTLLVVDDDPVVALEVEAALKRLGYAVAGTALSGEQALAQATVTNPDLVLMDLHLAGALGGVQAAQVLRQRLGTPVVFLADSLEEQDLRQALTAEPHSVLHRPLRDVELRSAIELALAQAKTQRELRLARQAAEEDSRAKATFLACLSGELRKPVGGVLGLSELLLCSQLDQDQRQTAEQMKDLALSFTGTLHKMLELSSLEFRQEPFEEVDFRLGEYLERVIAPHCKAAQARGVECRLKLCGVPDVLCGAARRLGQVLDQLLENAVRNTSSGSIRVEVGVTELPEPGPDPDGIGLLFHVRDTGCGLAPETLPNAFRSFWRQEATRPVGAMGQAQGLGLGLALCRQLVKRLGGGIWAESRPGLGSCFSFTVRMVERKKRACPQPDLPLDGERVLVVEDDLVNRMFLTRGLERFGAHVYPAESGGEALQLLRQHPFGAVIMDLQLPGVDGLTLTRMIRSGEVGERPELPIVAITADAGAHTRLRCLEAGMDAALSKPVDIDAIKNLLCGYFSRQVNQVGQGAARGSSDAYHDK
jgi:CheY-like chemotaxis protein